MLLLDGISAGGEGRDKVKVIVAPKDKVVVHSLEEELVEVMASVSTEDGGVVEVRKVCQTATQTQVLREWGKSRVFVCCPFICLLFVMMVEVVLLRGGGVVVVLVVSLLLRDN